MEIRKEECFDMSEIDENIWEFPNISTKKQRAGWYVPETTQHPAKMPTYLVDKIIEEYTKPGDVILDPMGGSGTTAVEAVKKGRNCIVVDYERKFCDLMQKNIDVANKQQTLTPKGKAVVIHGDARNLSSILGNVDQTFSVRHMLNVTLRCMIKRTYIFIEEGGKFLMLMYDTPRELRNVPMIQTTLPT